VRLAAGATRSQLSALVPALTVTSLQDAVRPKRRFSILIFFCAALGLMLVAWVQIGTFVMAGTLAELKDLGIRQALGAGRSRVLMRMIAEYAGSAAAAGVLAWMAVPPLTAYLVGALPADLVKGQSLDPGPRTLAFTMAASLAGFALLSLFPFVVIRRSSPLQLIQGRIGGAPVGAERIRQGLLVVQVTATAALLYVCGLMVHSVTRAVTYDYGFDSRSVLVFTPPFPGPPADLNSASGSRMSDSEFEALSREKSRRNVASLDALARTPGVVAAAGLWVVPLVEPGHFGGWEELRAVDGRSVPPLRVLVNAATPSFLKALGASLTLGSGFDSPDNLGAADVAIVNETFVRQFIPPMSNGDVEVQASPIGKVFQTELSRGRIVGVMKDLVYSKATEPRMPQVFFPAYDGGASRYLIIRTKRVAEHDLSIVRRSLESIWGPLAVDRFSLLRDSWWAELRPFVGQAAILTLFAGSSVLVAVIGLIGFLMHSVRLRARELAIRAALGATPAALSRATVVHALTLAGAALLAGGAIGVASGRLIGAQLFLVEAADPASIFGVALLLLVASWLSVLLPAREAARSNPAILIREL
jgi:hypothetical protein